MGGGRETGPFATSWQSTSFSTRLKRGAVQVLHLNGLQDRQPKTSGPDRHQELSI